ncbi:hypothetical protein P0D87_16105 [Paraburkholderia sp. RL17-368-BIF-A]|uniref:hypothetical protein n=1 Tax=Paraburkholderia sp. RL17-368-BIF-A TaxID=3031628 RepID=UPI0038C0B07C
MIDFQRHPLSAAFPTFTEDDLDALVEDIRQFGQRESGLALEGMILDGWNRYQACLRLGVDFNYLEFEDEYPGMDPRAYVKSKNYHRRHMTASQRAASIVALSQWAPAGNPNLATVARLPTNAELAREADVSPRTISHAKAAHEAGLGEAVISGALSLREADAQIKASRAPIIREQKVAPAHEAAAEWAARTDATVAQPSPRVDAVEDSSRDGDDDLIIELEALQNRVSVLSAEIDSLTATDHGAEIHKLTQLLVNADDKIARFEERMKDLKDFGAKFDALRKLLHVKSNREVVGAVRKLVEAKQ